MPGISARQAIIAGVFLMSIISGCATPSNDRANFKAPDGYELRMVKCRDLAEECAIFEPKIPSKLDFLREQAALKNNRQTAGIAAGAGAVIAAYAATDAYFRARNEKPNPFVSMAATAGSAYAAAAIAGVVYDFFAPRKK